MSAAKTMSSRRSASARAGLNVAAGALALVTLLVAALVFAPVKGAGAAGATVPAAAGLQVPALLAQPVRHVPLSS